MKFHVRNKHGELIVPSYAELRQLYERQFISDDDEVRREGSERWVRAGDMADLRPLRPRTWLHGNEFAWLAVAIAVVSLIACLLLAD